MTKSLIQIIILSLLVTSVVVGLELYRKAQAPTLPEIVEEQLTPLTEPNLPTQVLQELEKKSAHQLPKEQPTLPF